MGSKITEVKKIVDLLTNNIYSKNKPEWVDFESGLLRMSFRELNATYVLILGCQNYKKDQGNSGSSHTSPDLPPEYFDACNYLNPETEFVKPTDKSKLLPHKFPKFD